MLTASYVDPNASCPVCGASVFFYQSPHGGRVFFDQLGPPWPKHPCTDNGASVFRPAVAVAAAIPAWQQNGWSAVAKILRSEAAGDWANAQVSRVPEGPLEGAFPASRVIPDAAPTLVRPPGEDGVGRLSWLDEAGRPRATVLVRPAVQIAPPERVEIAAAGHAAPGYAEAVEEVAALLYAAARKADDPDWARRLSRENFRILQVWLGRAAEAGSALAERWRTDVERAAEARLATLRPDPAWTAADQPDDVRLADDGPEYRAYTREFDEEVAARDLADNHALAELSRQLDREMAVLLAEPDLSSGANLRGTAITLLVDNSGSMRGRKVAVAATVAATLAEWIIRAGGMVEILGFTTRTWKGGRAQEKWLRNGRPARPGRLNELRHVVYKTWNEPFEGPTGHLGVMLKEGLLKENIDGEALAWAYRRILAVPALSRRILVLSDGAPVDDATVQVKGQENLLRSHLASVASAIEDHGLVRVAALGIEHDPSGFFRHSATCTDAPDGVAAGWRLITEEVRAKRDEAAEI